MSNWNMLNFEMARQQLAVPQDESAEKLEKTDDEIVVSELPSFFPNAIHRISLEFDFQASRSLQNYLGIARVYYRLATDV